jgi:hypothetical protein
MGISTISMHYFKNITERNLFMKDYKKELEKLSYRTKAYSDSYSNIPSEHLVKYADAIKILEEMEKELANLNWEESLRRYFISNGLKGKFIPKMDKEEDINIQKIIKVLDNKLWK